MYTNPTVSDFKLFFVRDFPYQVGTPVDLNKYIQDSDIQKAIDITSVWINSGLFSSQAFYTIGFQYLAAHNLVESIKSSSQGVSGVYEFLVANKSVGSISIGYAIPDQFSKNPYFAMLTKTSYGAKYLELILPYLVGPMFIAEGWTQA